VRDSLNFDAESDVKVWDGEGKYKWIPGTQPVLFADAEGKLHIEVDHNFGDHSECMWLSEEQENTLLDWLQERKMWRDLSGGD